MRPPVADPLAADLDHILAHTEGLWDELRGARLFITGGTGFYGSWLLASFVRAVEEFGLGAKAVVLTRAPGAFARKAPQLAGHPAIELHEGDVRDLTAPPGPFSHVIHAATESSTTLNTDAPRVMFETIALGTQRVLELAHQSGARRFLLTSSGAVYGRQPVGLSHVEEDYAGGPDPTDPGSAYAEGKRVAELLGVLAHCAWGLEVTIARGFAFVGPHLPLDVHFAVGNFIRDGLAGGPIRVSGDGTPVRSYLHAADLMIWLWTILQRGAPGRPYNVGSEEAVSIAELARRCAVLFDTDWHLGKPPTPGAPAPRYVPSTARARSELGLRTRIGLDDALARTIRWHRFRTPPILQPS
jgi:dTDP-glucose 4,6-dehydratase